MMSGNKEAATPRAQVSVVVPSYHRPVKLVACVRALLAQSIKPVEIVVTLRQDDSASREALIDEGLYTAVKLVSVDEAGMLPPVRLGLAAATGDFVCLVDDDAVPHHDWLASLIGHYGDATVGAVGGRVVNFLDGKQVQYPVAKRAGVITWYGNIVGNLYKDQTTRSPRRVDFIQGGNASFRRSALATVTFDERLNANVAFHWEVDVCFQLRRAGYQIVFDPAARVDHFTAPRAVVGLRDPSNRESVYWYSHNYTLIMWKHLRAWKRIAFALYFTLIGQRASWGVITLIDAWLRHRELPTRSLLTAAFAGKWHGLRRAHSDV